MLLPKASLSNLPSSQEHVGKCPGHSHIRQFLRVSTPGTGLTSTLSTLRAWWALVKTFSLFHLMNLTKAFRSTDEGRLLSDPVFFLYSSKVSILEALELHLITPKSVSVDQCYCSKPVDSPIHNYAKDHLLPTSSNKPSPKVSGPSVSLPARFSIALQPRWNKNLCMLVKCNSLKTGETLCCSSPHCLASNME